MNTLKRLPDDFAVLILTHGRPNNVRTYSTLRSSGYTGRIVLVVDDEDKTLAEYEANYPGEVVVFNKKAIADRTDEGDNFDDRRTITHARNASYDVAESLGIRWFVQLDDDYTNFSFRTDATGQYPKKQFKVRSKLDLIFVSVLAFYVKSGASCVALAQGGDFIGGKENQHVTNPTLRRKCMNSFFCCTNRRVWFVGRMNEDVNTYTSLGRVGVLFFTIPLVNLDQLATQSNPGGISETYKAYGTYVKSFYTVMFSPSCTKVSMMNTKHARIHHAIEWRNAVPVILRREHASRGYADSRHENDGEGA